jgi:hypothetical protein
LTGGIIQDAFGETTCKVEILQTRLGLVRSSRLDVQQRKSFSRLSIVGWSKCRELLLSLPVVTSSFGIQGTSVQRLDRLQVLQRSGIQPCKSCFLTPCQGLLRGTFLFVVTVGTTTFLSSRPLHGGQLSMMKGKHKQDTLVAKQKSRSFFFFEWVVEMNRECKKVRTEGQTPIQTP